MAFCWCLLNHAIFIRTIFITYTRLKNAQERRRAYILDTAQDHGNNLFSSRLIFISATSPLVLCVYNFVLNLFYVLLQFFLAVQGRVAACSIERMCASGWFVRMENINCTLNTNNYV